MGGEGLEMFEVPHLFDSLNCTHDRDSKSTVVNKHVRVTEVELCWLVFENLESEPAKY